MGRPIQIIVGCFLCVAWDVVMGLAKLEKRLTIARIENPAENDLCCCEEQERFIRVYVAADAPEWSGTVVRGDGETEERHAEHTELLRELFGEPGQA